MKKGKYYNFVFVTMLDDEKRRVKQIPYKINVSDKDLVRKFLKEIFIGEYEKIDSLVKWFQNPKERIVVCTHTPYTVIFTKYSGDNLLEMDPYQ